MASTKCVFFIASVLFVLFCIENAAANPYPSIGKIYKSPRIHFTNSNLFF